MYELAYVQQKAVEMIVGMKLDFAVGPIRYAELSDRAQVSNKRSDALSQFLVKCVAGEEITKRTFEYSVRESVDGQLVHPTAR
jgi:hypothetical protein